MTLTRVDIFPLPLLFCVFILPHTGVFIIFAVLGLSLIYPVFRIYRIHKEERQIVSTTKVARENVRDQDEDAVPNRVTIAPSSMVMDKETDAEKAVVVTKDMM